MKSNTCADEAHFTVQVGPWWTTAGAIKPIPPWRCSLLYQGEELLAVSASVLDRAEAIGEVGSVLQGFELRLGVRIVIRHVRAAMGLGDLEVNEERGDGL